MKNLLSCRVLKSIYILFLVFLSFFCFQYNFLNFASDDFFDYFQYDSQSLVIGGIIANNLSLEKNNSNIGFIGRDGIFKYPENVADSYRVLFLGESENKNTLYSPYRSSYGIQGVIFTKIDKFFGFNDKNGYKRLYLLNCINSFFLSIVVVTISIIYRKIYNNSFAVIFFITMISSPWIVSFARNLFWVPFLWFLPGLLSAVIYLTKNTVFKTLLLIGIVVTVFIKSLAGYEYLSTITLFACSVFVIAPFFNNFENEFQKSLRMSFFVFVACIIGFSCALLFHANMRGDSIFDGLKIILENDVKRRTYGDPTNFNNAIKASLESSPISVLKLYIYNWKTDLVAWLPGIFFKFLVVLGIICIFYKFLLRDITLKRDVVLLSFFFITSSSWFVLAKGHSYIHTHMNFVLWYFGFIQALIYVVYSTMLIIFFNLCDRLRILSLRGFNI